MSRQRRYPAQRSIGRVGPRVSAYSWDPNDGFISPTPVPVRKPRLTVRCEYPDGPLEPIEVTFSLSPSYGVRTPGDALGWLRRMMREHGRTYRPWTDTRPLVLPLRATRGSRVPSHRQTRPRQGWRSGRTFSLRRRQRSIPQPHPYGPLSGSRLGLDYKHLFPQLPIASHPRARASNEARAWSKLRPPET